MNKPVTPASAAASSLRDPSLFRQKAYLGGSWADADGGATITVTDPATGDALGTVPRMGKAETARGHRRGRQGPARMARQDRQGTRRDHAQNGPI